MSLESQPRLRVLLVDDEHKLTDLLRLELDVEGYDVDVASDGASGLIRSRTEPAPDLIILDGTCRTSAASTSVNASVPGESQSPS